MLPPAAAFVWLTLALAAGPAPPPAAVVPPAAAFAALGADARQDLIILGEARPIFVRLRVALGDRPFRLAWADAGRELGKRLDADRDGKLTPAEAEAGGLPLFLAASGRPRGEVDVKPKDGTIADDELLAALGGAEASFRVVADARPDRRTDALFDHVDRDKDGVLARAELAVIGGTLRQLDRDDDELIALGEVDAAAATAARAAGPTAMGLGRANRDPGTPAVVALAADESPLRVVRLLLKKYDTTSARASGRPDSKLAAEEFAIPPAAFAAADGNRDGLLANDEVRKYLATDPVDLVVDVALPPEATGQAAVQARAAGGDGDGPPAGFAVRQLAPNLVEIEAGLVRVAFEVDDGLAAVDAARRTLRARFKAADLNLDDYVEESELTDPNTGLASPLGDLFRLLNRGGKLYAPELDDHVARQAAAARGRLTLTGLDGGRSLFGMLDGDGDRRLGAREVLDTYTRVLACDRDRDGRVTPEEVPHQVHLTLLRGDLAPMLAAPANGPANVAVAVVAGPSVVPARPLAGPDWFRRMDRNHDGDVSRREFLGTHAQYDRLDLDADGLLGPAEADAASRKAP